jgi:general secretion pathway protein A
VVLTGEVGTGKTLLLRSLLQLLKQSNDVAYAYIFNSQLSPIEFLQYIARDLGLTASNKNKGELLIEIADYVIDRSQRKLTTVLVVDEAHHLSEEILEEIRLLTNLETMQEKLLQILLVGQPELDEKLDSPRLRQLKQRVAVRSHLVSLDSDQTKGYIERRLQLAGAPYPSALFPPETIAAVYQHSQGLPRLINTVCENALIAAFARQMRSVSPDIIDDIATEFRLGVQTRAVEETKTPDEVDVRKAAKALLEIYARVQADQKREEELGMRARVRLP